MKFIFRTHSLVDIITNSSSEIFTISSEKTAEFLSEMINSFCVEKKLSFKCTPDCLSYDQYDWEVKNSIEVLERSGYTVSKREDWHVHSLSIDRDRIYTDDLEPLTEFLVKELKAVVSYD